MPEKETIERAKRAKRKGKPATTQAGEFVREEMKHAKEVKHGVKSSRQAVAIGLSEARRAGVDLPPPQRGRVKAKTQRSAISAYHRGQKTGPLRGTTNGTTKSNGKKKTTARSRAKTK